MLSRTKFGLLTGVAVASLLCCVLIKVNVNAATEPGSSLTTSPISVDLNDKPGQTVSTTLQVMNNSNSAESISTRLYEFKAQGNNGQAAIYVPKSNDPSVNWVRFSRNSFTAEPGVWNEVTMTVSLPRTASLGYYYAVLFTPNVNVYSHSNTVKGSNAILVLVNTNSSNEVKQLKIKSYSSQKSLYQFLPANFNIDVQNTGNIHLAPEGDVYISRTVSGKSIATLQFNNGGGNVLPQSDRIFKVQWNDGLPAYENTVVNGHTIVNSSGQPKQHLVWSSTKSISKIRFGKYYAHLVLVYNNGLEDVPVSGYVSFWVIPWEFLLICVFIVVATIALFSTALWRMNKGVVKGLRKKSHKQDE